MVDVRYKDEILPGLAVHLEGEAVRSLLSLVRTRKGQNVCLMAGG